jgi:hypothetical protein
MAGRPSKYDPSYCDLVVEHMKDGSSLTSFAAEIDVARSTINEWMDAHPEFSEACARAKAKCAAWWEKTNRTLASTGVGNQGACKLGLTNMAPDDWKEKVETVHSGKVYNVVERRIVRPGD